MCKLHFYFSNIQWQTDLKGFRSHFAAGDKLNSKACLTPGMTQLRRVEKGRPRVIKLLMTDIYIDSNDFGNSLSPMGP